MLSLQKKQAKLQEKMNSSQQPVPQQFQGKYETKEDCFVILLYSTFQWHSILYLLYSFL